MVDVPTEGTAVPDNVKVSLPGTDRTVLEVALADLVMVRLQLCKWCTHGVLTGIEVWTVM